MAAFKPPAVELGVPGRPASLEQVCEYLRQLERVLGHTLTHLGPENFADKGEQS